MRTFRDQERDADIVARSQYHKELANTPVVRLERKVKELERRLEKLENMSKKFLVNKWA